MNDDSTLETVATTNFPAQAEVIRSVLESGGFEAFVVNSNAPTYVGLVESVRVMVESSQVEDARKFLAENQEAVASEE